MSINIPQNDCVDTTEQEVETAISAVLNDPDFQKKFGISSVLGMNHGRRYHKVPISQRVANEVIKRFKAAGYYAHYCTSIQGTPYCLTITKYPTDHDI